MNIRFSACGLALAACFLASTTSAATVTATFEGTVSTGSGGFSGQVGQGHILEIVGQDDAPGTDFLSPPSQQQTVLSAGFDPFTAVTFSTVNPMFSDATSYQLDRISYTLPGSSQSFTSTDVTAYIGNDVDRLGTGPLDIIFIQGLFTQGAVSGAIEYFAAFDASTLASSALDEAIVAGLANSTTNFENAGVGFIGGDGAIGRISLTNIVSVDNPGGGGSSGGGSTGGGSGGGMAGGGGSTGGGGGSAGGGGGNGGAPMPAPVPLPAGAPLLIAGLGALAWLRRRR